jgi:hypothetical protein
MLDIFRSDAFSLTRLTDSILKVPFKPGRIGALRLFRESGITTTSVVIEEKGGQLRLIQTTPRGGPGGTTGATKRKARSFLVPHLQEESKVLADEVQNVRAFGSEDAAQGVQAVIDERLMILRDLHEVTLEHHRVGAIKGQILDADGSVLFDLFTEFGVSQQEAELDPAGEVRSQAVNIQRLSERALGAAAITGYRAFCGDAFFDALIEAESVKESLKYQEGAVLRGDLRSGFEYGGITWENYRGRLGKDLADVEDETKDVDGDNVTPFFPDDEAYVVPVGPDIWRTYFAPADFNETVNTVGLPLYAKSAIDQEFQRWTKIHTQSNPLCLCLRPRAVIKVTLAS